MIESERSTERVVDQDTVQQSIALSYVKAWQNLPQAPADLLGTVLPFLAARDLQEFPTIRLCADARAGDRPDAHRNAWESLEEAAIAVHQAKVRHLWYRWNPETEKEHRCFSDLVWTTEARFDPVAREIELVFWDRLVEYLPAILVPLSDFETRRPPARMTPAANRSLTVYFYDLQP